jgi:hypothetical protein
MTEIPDDYKNQVWLLNQRARRRSRGSNRGDDETIRARAVLSLSRNFFLYLVFLSLSLSFRFAERRAFVFASGMLAMIGKKSLYLRA